MKSRFVKMFGLAYLLATTHLMTVSCSSSEEEGTGEEVAAEGENAEGEEGNVENGENGENVENAENAGNNAEEGNIENENFGENNNNGNNELGNNANAAGGNEFGNAESGNPAANAETNLAANTAAPAGEDGNLQQIIEEMNQNGAAPAADATAEAPAAGGFDNLAQGAEGSAAPAAAAAPTEAVSSTPAAPGLPELGSKMAYVVQKGDTLAKIAQRVYGDMNKWTEIADFTGIANPKLIYPGDVVYYQLTEQSMGFASAYESVQRSEVEVAQGDTLATISSRVFGNSSLWKLIWRQNDNIDNPDQLTAGTKIYFVDAKAMASLDQEMKANLKTAKKSDSKKNKVSKNSVKKNSIKTAAKSVKKVIEVANDSIDSFNGSINSQNLVNRLI